MGADLPRIYVVSGTQGAGKTTVADILARRFDRGVHISADTLQKMIVSGGEWPVSSQREVNNDSQGEAVRQLRLRQKNMCLLARSFLAEGFTVVLDDIIIGSRFDELREDLRDLAFAFIMLSPDIETVRARERQRGTNLWPEWEWLTESILATSSRPGLWLDTSAQAPDETVDDILRRSGEALLQPAGVQQATR